MSNISPQDSLEFWLGVGPNNRATLKRRFDRWFNRTSELEIDDVFRKRCGAAGTGACIKHLVI